MVDGNASAELTASDDRLLQRAIELAAQSLDDGTLTPFGAVVAVGETVLGEGVSQVVKKIDPTAHAEVEALRSAATQTGSHLMPEATMYASGEPCPMCLIACCWARVPRLVFGATTRDIAELGFEDLQFYRELTLPAQERTIIVEIQAAGALAETAKGVLQGWVANLAFPVIPKL